MDSGHLKKTKTNIRNKINSTLQTESDSEILTRSLIYGKHFDSIVKTRNNNKKVNYFQVRSTVNVCNIETV